MHSSHSIVAAHGSTTIYRKRSRVACGLAPSQRRYLEALAAVEDSTNAKRALQRVTTPKRDAAGRRCAGFNPLARRDAELFQILMAGRYWLRGLNKRGRA